jgi:hypothetical protein
MDLRTLAESDLDFQWPLRLGPGLWGELGFPGSDETLPSALRVFLPELSSSKLWDATPGEPVRSEVVGLGG